MAATEFQAAERRIFAKLVRAFDDAYHDAVSTYRRPIVAKLCEIGFSEFDAETAFLEAVSDGLKRFEPGKASLYRFLFTIAYRKAVDLVGRHRETLVEPSDPIFEGLRSAKREFEETATEANPVSELMGKALTLLFERCQKCHAVLQMDALGDGTMSSKFASQITGIPANQIPVYRQRGREYLKEILLSLGVEQYLRPLPIQSRN